MSENVNKSMEQNPMMDFMDDIEKSLRLPKPGDIIDGKVDQVMSDAVIVNMGCSRNLTDWAHLALLCNFNVGCSGLGCGSFI